MNIKESLDQEFKKAGYKEIATKIIDNIERLDDRESSKHRWVWELLQNAKDASESTVDIEIHLSRDQVEFRHNGNPFTAASVTCLIRQVSSKDRGSKDNDEPSRKTGKFGTGFLTTHLLSREVLIHGILELPSDAQVKEVLIHGTLELQSNKQVGYKEFQLPLDRSSDQIDSIIASVDRSFSKLSELDNDELHPILSNYCPNQKCDTCFIYKLNDKGLKVACSGLKDLHSAIIYTLCFLPNIKSVKVFNYKDVNPPIKYQVSKLIEISENSKLISIARNANKQDEEIIKIYTISDVSGKVNLGVKLIQLEKSEIYSLTTISPQVPIIFCDFPLIGSENFPFPVIINSSSFNPKEPRDGIRLNGNSEKGLENQELYEIAVKLFIDFLGYAVKQKWCNLHFLAQLKSIAQLPSKVESLDEEWYWRKVAVPCIEALRSSEIVETSNGDRISLVNSKIPKYFNEEGVGELFELTSKIYRTELPKAEHILDWHKVSESAWGDKLLEKVAYKLEDFLKDIANSETLDNLTKLINENEQDGLNWLNRVIAFVEKDKNTNLDEFAIIPNQHGQLKKRDELFRDRNVSTEYKNVLRILGHDWKEDLAHQEIQVAITEERDTEEAIRQVNEILRKGEHSEIKSAVLYLASCFPKKLPENKELLVNREEVWYFVETFFQETLERKEFNHADDTAWQEADKWISTTIVNAIEKLCSVENLSTHLGDSKDCLEWLNKFIHFSTKLDTVRIDTKTIFPNQKGEFRKKLSLFYDDSIPNEIKDVLEGLGDDCRSLLLDRAISFDQSWENRNTAGDIAKKISDCIIKLREQQEEPTPDTIRALYKLISYYPKNNKTADSLLYYWQFLRQLFPSEIPERQFIENLDEFSWKECKLWILELICSTVSNSSHLDDLTTKFFTDDRPLQGDAQAPEEQCVQWLDSLINFVIQENQEYLRKYALIPNQNKIFKLQKDLFRDIQIPEALKEVLFRLTDNDWREILLHSDLALAHSLFEEKQSKNIDAIAAEIDGELKTYHRNVKERGGCESKKFVEVVQGMLDWSEEQDDEEVERLFSYFYQNKPQLFLDTLGDKKEVRSNVFVILKDHEKLKSLARIAESKISDKDIDSFVDQHEDFRTFQQITNTISINELEEACQNPEEFRRYLAIQKQTAGDELPGIFECDIKSGDSEKDEELLRRIGRQGEEIVYEKLCERFGEERVKWLNQHTESHANHDFQVSNEDMSVLYYIDAKSTPRSENNSDGTPLYIGSSEWRLLESSDNFYIARVFKLNSDEPNVKFLKFERILESTD